MDNIKKININKILIIEKQVYLKPFKIIISLIISLRSLTLIVR